MTCDTRICSLNFVCDRTAGPQLFLWNAKKLFQLANPEKQRRIKRYANDPTVNDNSDSLTYDVTPLSFLADVALSTGYVEVTGPQNTLSPRSNCAPECQAFADAEDGSGFKLARDTAELHKEMKELKAQLQSARHRFMFAHIENETDKVKFFTGLPNKETFYVLRDFLARFPLKYHYGRPEGTFTPTCFSCPDMKLLVRTILSGETPRQPLSDKHSPA